MGQLSEPSPVIYVMRQLLLKLFLVRLPVSLISMKLVGFNGHMMKARGCKDTERILDISINYAN